MVCVAGGDHTLCFGLVGVCQEVWKRKKNGEIVDVSAST